jgi:hypothetical protein
MRIIIACIFLLIGLGACGSDSQKVDLPALPTNAIPLADTASTKIARIDTMPALTDTTTADSSSPRRLEKPNLLPPQITFVDTVFHFGTIAADSIVEHVFEFTNTGGKPLDITKVETSCGCTAASVPFLLISKGEKSSITTRFDSKGKKGKQEKSLTVFSNAENSPHTLILKGEVK